MKKAVGITFLTFAIVLVSMISSSVYATSTGENTNEIITNDTKSQLVAIKNTEMKSIEDFQEVYGSKVYGTVAYVLNKVRIYSIPFAFLGIAISAIYEFILGARHLEARDKGFNSMIAIVTLLVICQVLPLIFAIVVKGWRG